MKLFLRLSKIVFLFLSFICLNSAYSSLFAQVSNVVTFTTTGNNSIIIPSGVTSVTVQLWGGGGAGGGASTASPTAGGGGAGGAYKLLTIAVTGGQNFSYSVGSGGLGVSGAAGGAGTITWFNTNTTANGASGGAGGGVGTVSLTPGTGGTSTTTNQPAATSRGGAGATGGAASLYGGGGGGSAGSGGAGGAGSTTTSTGGAAGAGTGIYAGSVGANGQTGDGDGVNAIGWGAGGSGARQTSGSRAGGNGANGKIIVTFRNVTGTIPIGGAIPLAQNIPYYSNLQNALDFISLASVSTATTTTILELQDETYNLSSTLYLNAISGVTSTRTVTIRPRAGLASKITYADNLSALLFSNSASYYIFDGLNTGGASLTIENTNTGFSGANTIALIGGSANNVFRNCNIYGSSTSSSLGTIYFGAASGGGQGNSTNSFINNNIGPAGSNLPTVAISSFGTNTNATSRNSGNVFTNNNIYDFFAQSNNSFGIYMGTATTNWVIDGNSFYLTSNQTITDGSFHYTPIRLDNTSSGVNTTISNNYIGGKATLAGGAAMVIGGVGAYKGIKINGAAGVKNVVTGNFIRNIDFTSNSTDVCALIYHVDGNADVTNNIIGSQTATNSIIFQSTFPGYNDSTISGSPWRSASFNAILAGGASGEAVAVAATVLISNNTIGGIAGVRSGTGDIEIRAIDLEGVYSDFTVSGNTVGGTVANSISNNTNNSTIGIVGLTPRSPAVHVISNNIIRNITSTLSADEASVKGIQTQSATYRITGNTITGLRTNYSKVGFYGLVGLGSTGDGPNQVVEDNNISDLVQTSTANTATSALLASGGSGGGTSSIARNKIWAITATNAHGKAVQGITNIMTGSCNTVNNMVILGFDIAGNSPTIATGFTGILDRSLGSTQNILYNSIHIGGSLVTSAGVISTGLMTSSTATATRTIANNLIVNDRGSTGNTNIGLWLNSTTGVTDYNNNMFATSSASNFLGAVGGGGYTSLAGYISGRPTAIHSVSVAVDFFDPRTDLRCTPSPSIINFLVANEGKPVAGFTTDYYGTARNAYTPDPGFHEFTCRGCWVGKNSAVWEVDGLAGAGGNWEDGIIPLTNTNTKVYDAPFQPTINATSGIRPVLDLYLKAPGLVTLSNITGGKLQVYGNFSNRGGFINGVNGTLEMYGSVTQIIPQNLLVSNTLRDLIVSNNTTTFGLALQAPVDITRSLTFSSVGLKLSTLGWLLTMKSTNAFTAFIGDLTGKTIDGTILLERYLPAKAAWRFVAAPVQVSTSPSVRSSWQEGSTAPAGFGTQITGPTGTGGGFDQVTQRFSMKFFNPAISDYTDVTNTSAAVANDAGYMLFVRGDRSVAVGGVAKETTLRVRGNVRQGNQTFPVSINKFASIGNPYVAQVDLRTVNFNTVAQTYYRWNPAIAGLYGVGGFETFTHNGTNYAQVPGGAIANNIENGQAFYVRNNSTTLAGSLVFKETDKSTGSVTFSRGGGTGATDGKVLSLNMYSTIGGAELLVDGWRLRFRDNYSNSFDNDDAEKFPNTYNNIGIRSNNKTLVVESRKTIMDRDTIFMNMTSTPAASYRFALVPEEFVQPGLQAFLVDKFTTTTKAVSLTDSTWYAFSVTADAASRAADRFYITFTQQKEAPLKYISVAASRNNDASNIITWDVDNEEKMVNYNVERGENGTVFVPISKQNAKNDISKKASYSFTDLKPSTTVDIFYRIKGTGISGKTYYSDQVKISTLVGKPSIAITPNPVTNGIVNLKMEHLTPGEYTIKLVNKAGQNVLQKTVKLQDWRQFVSFPVNLPQGIYVITVANSKAVIHTENLSISR